MEANNQEQDQDLDVVKVTPEESIDENTEIFKKEVSLRFYIIEQVFYPSVIGLGLGPTQGDWETGNGENIHKDFGECHENSLI